MKSKAAEPAISGLCFYIRICVEMAGSIFYT